MSVRGDFFEPILFAEGGCFGGRRFGDSQLLPVRAEFMIVVGLKMLLLEPEHVELLSCLHTPRFSMIVVR